MQLYSGAKLAKTEPERWRQELKSIIKIASQERKTTVMY